MTRGAAAIAIVGSFVAAAAPTPVLVPLADVPLPGATSRFDYASLDSAAGLLYLNHMGAGEVVVFDVRARAVVAVLPATPSCTGVLAVPELGRVFVSAASAGEVVVFDAKSRAVLARVPAGRFPDGLAYEPTSGRLFVSDESGRQVTVVDARGLKVLGHVPLGGEAGNTQVDARAHLVYTNDQTHGDLVAIDPLSLRIVSRTPLGMKGNHGLVIDAERRVAFVASEDEDQLAVVDLTKRTVVARFPVGHAPDVLAFDATTRRLFVACESGAVSTFRETRTGVVAEGTQQVGANAHVVAVDSATRVVYLPLKNVGGRPVLRLMREAP